MLARMFEIPLRAQRLELARLFERIGRWLDPRVAAADQLERRSRDFPTIRFRDEAVTLWIDDLQHRALEAEPQPGVGESLRRAGQHLVDGVAQLPIMVEQELILPRTLGALDAALRAILDSIERFRVPTPAMFDVDARRASDLFGLAGLAFRATTGSIDQLRRLAADVGKARLVLRDAFPAAAPGARGAAGAAGAAGPAALAAAPSIPDRLDGVARMILGAISLVPILPELIELTLRAGYVRLRFGLLDAFSRIEESVFQLRRDVLEVFYVDLPDLLTEAIGFLMAAEAVVVMNVTYYLDFAAELGDQILDTIIAFSGDLQRFLTFWTTVFNTVIGILDAIRDFDLVRFFFDLAFGWMIAIAPAPIAALLRRLRSSLPTFTLGDLARTGANAALTVLRGTLTGMVLTVRGALIAYDEAAELQRDRYIPTPWPLPDIDLPNLPRIPADWFVRLEGAEDLIGALFQDVRPHPAETAAFSLPTRFPDIAALWSAAAAASGIGPAFTALGGQLQRGVADVLGTGVTLLLDAERVFDEASRDAASLGSPAVYRRIAADADAGARAAFGDQVDELRARAAATPTDAVTRAFESWLSSTGFEVIGTAIPLYVAEMDGFWREQVAAGAELTAVVTPTSPRHLLRRARLSRVHMRELTIRAEGRALDPALADLVAARFRDAVGDAYRTGRAELERLGVE